YEELWIGTWEEIGERLLRDYAAEAGLDPFVETVGPADRLAMLLDRFEELPLRRHEIRGNPAGLLARLLRRIDALKAEAVGADAHVVVLGRVWRGGQDQADAARAVVAAIEGRLEKPSRAGEEEVPVRFWRCRNERAQAQAVAHEIEHLIAAGTDPEKVCVIVDEPARQGSAVAAAMEEHGVPF